MQISFFEEYYSDKNVSKLPLITFPIKLYLGCTTISQFLKVKHAIEKKCRWVKQVIYWPLLTIDEGYWFSSFTKTHAIRRVIEEIHMTDEFFPVLWDAEFPILNKKLLITQFPNLIKNSKIIYETLYNQLPNHPIIVAQFPRSNIKHMLSTLAGVAFPFTHYHRLDMLYSSMLTTNNKQEYIRNNIRKNILKYKHYSVGIGLIDKGEGDPTPLLSTQELERDIRVAKNEGVEEVVIYRLGGLNKNYITVLQKYI